MIARVSAAPAGSRSIASTKRAVDLDDVDRKLLEIAQRRVAGAEIVDREVYAERLQLREGASSIASVRRMITVSVISSVSRDGGEPESASASATSATNEESASCRPETFTAIDHRRFVRRCVPPFVRLPARLAQAPNGRAER